MGRPKKFINREMVEEEIKQIEDLPNDIEDAPVQVETKEKPEYGIALEDFSMQIPMPSQSRGSCIIRFEQGQKITDPYVVKFLKTTSKPVRYL